jgi:hypothetical protein
MHVRPEPCEVERGCLLNEVKRLGPVLAVASDDDAELRTT